MRVPRFTPRGLATAAAIIAACGLVASCTSGNSQSAQQSKDSATAVATAATPSSLSPIPPAPTDGPSAPSTAATQFNVLRTVVAYRKDAAPVSQDLSGTVNVDGYLQTVMRSNKAIWSEIFKGVSGVSMPALTYDVTSKSDRYVSACTRNGEKIVVTPTYGKFFYCSADNQPYGAVALPTDVLTPVWKQNSRQRADLAVAVSTSRQASLIILKSLEQQLSLPKPSDIGRQYTASCLAGVWGHAVYAQDAFPVQDLGTALSWSFAIPSEVDGTVTSPNPRNDEPAVTAWTAGFRTGDPSQCGLRFWN